jgi:hypothetical protein
MTSRSQDDTRTRLDIGIVEPPMTDPAPETALQDARPEEVPK